MPNVSGNRSIPRGSAKVAITVRLDPEQAKRLQALAAADNRSLTNYVETTLARDMAMRDEASRVITMFVAPGPPSPIEPSDVQRSEGESDDAYARRQALTVELWSIPGLD